MVFSRRQSSSSSSKSMFALVWEEIKKPMPIKFYILLCYKIISMLQILALMLEISMNFFNHTEGTWKPETERTFILYKVLDLAELNAVGKAIFIICFVLVWIHYILLFCVFFSTKIKINGLNKLSVPLKHAMLFHQFVLFLPIHMFMIQVIKAGTTSNASNRSVFMALGGVIIGMNLMIALLDLRCYSPLYAQKVYAKRNAELTFLDLFFKTFMSCCIVFVPTSPAIKWVTIIFTLVYVLIYYYKFHTQLPYFQIKLLEAYCYILGAKIAMALSIFIAGIFDEFRVVRVPDLPMAAFLLSTYIAIRGQFYKMTRTVTNALTFEERHYKSEHDVFIHLFALRYVFKRASGVSIKLGKTDSTNWNMLLNGVLARHNENCSLATCGCRMFLEIDETFKGTGLRREKFKDLQIILMRDLYEKGVERVNHSELILLNLAQFYLLYLKNYLKSYLVLQTFEKKVQKTFETEVLIDYLKKKVQERMEKKLSGASQEMGDAFGSSNNLNLTALVQNDIQFIQLKKLVHEQAVKQLKFWDMIDNFELNTKNIEASCEEVDVIRNKIEKLWESLSKINQKCSSHYLLFGLYQTLINNTVKRGERFLNDYSRMQGVNLQEKEGVTNNNLYDAQTVVIRISMKRDKIGLIEECSGDVDVIFGYSNSELINSNVATLMSTFFKERHHTFVMNHFERGTENVLNRQKSLYGLHREGHIFPIFLYVSIYPNIETGLSYMGIIRNKKVYNNYILVKSDGTVDSYSPEIAEYLGLESRKRYNITEICPEFEKINNAFNYTTVNKYDLKEDFTEFKAEGQTKRQPDQIKLSETDSQRLMVEHISTKKKDTGSMNSGVEDQDKGTATPEQKDDNSVLKSKERSNQGLKTAKIKAMHKKLKRLNTEDIDEYKRVYDQLSISGSVLSFIPQRDKNEGARNFLCTVADEIFDYSILRIITLGRNDENLEGENRDKKRLAKEGSAKEIALLGGDILNNSAQDDIGISGLPNSGEPQTFKNPFSPSLGEKDIDMVKSSNRSVSLRQNKGAILKLLKTSHENFDTQNPPASKSIIYETKENQSRASMISDDGRSVNYSDNDQDQFETGFNDSRDFIQEMVQGDVQQGTSSSVGTNLTSRGGAMSKFEALLYKKEEAKISNKFKSYFLIIVACIVMAAISTSTTNNNLQEGSEKVQKLLSVGQRISALLNLNFNSRILYLHLNQYIDTTRHLADKNIANYPQVAFDNVASGAITLPKVNVAVMNDIFELHQVSQTKFFSTKVELKYPTVSMQDHNVETLDTFEAIHTLVIAALQVGSSTLSALSTQIDSINYILLNSMNDLYLEVQNGYKVYESDLEETLAGTQAVTWGIAIGVVSIYVMFLAILIRDLANTHQDKIRFWNSLIKLDTAKSMGHRKLLVVFKENFENSSSHAPLKKALMEAKKQELKELKATKAKEQVNVFKRLKSYKLRNRSYLSIFPFLAVLALIIVFFVLTEVLVVEQLENKRVYMQEIKQSESYYQLNLLTLNGIYEYLSEGASKELEGLPIVTALDQNLDRLSRLTDFTSSFDSHSYFDPRDFIQMNLCYVYDSAGERLECNTDGKGINAQGLVGVLTYAQGAMQGAFDYATTSTGSTTDIQTGFNRESLIILETELKYIADGFRILSQSLADSESKEQDKFQKGQLAALFVFVLVLLLLNYFMVWRGFKRIDGQKFDNMKILRVIPTPMILESKMLKTYLLKTFKDDLSSITNKL